MLDFQEDTSNQNMINMSIKTSSLLRINIRYQETQYFFVFSQYRQNYKQNYFQQSRERMGKKRNQAKSRNQKQKPVGKEKKKAKSMNEKGGSMLGLMGKNKKQKGGGQSIFKIIPEGMDTGLKDQFAALGYGEEQFEDENQNMEVDQQQENGYQLEEQQPEKQLQNEEFHEDEAQFEEVQEGEYEGEFQGEEEGDYVGEEDQLQAQEQEQPEEGEQEENIKFQQDEEDEENKKVDLSVINLRIKETLSILESLPRLGGGKPRKYFIEKLKKYIHQYYGYNLELIDHFLNFLNPSEMIQLFEANETQRPLTIRTNTLKTRRKELAQALIQRGVNLDPLAEWSNVGIKIYDSKVPIGATPEYLAGHYMLQSASSFLPVLALDPQLNEKVLDMAAAPGGKTTYIAQLMKNTGSVFANDLKKERLKALQFNLYRLGVTNTVITCRDGRKYPEIFPNTFDKVLLDSPCTGLGIISKDSSIKANRLQLDIYKNSHIQKQLILAAIDCTKVGGVVVYSTCSVSPLENEEVVNYAMKKRYVKVVDIDDLVPVGEPGLIKFLEKRYFGTLKRTKRIYPHVHNMDGFYVAKLVKLENGKKTVASENGNPEPEQ